MQDAVGIEVDLGDFVRDHQNGDAAFGEPANDLVDPVARADVDADRRTVEDQDLRRRGEPLRQHDALLIAARQRRHGVFRLADLDGELADALGDGGGFLRLGDQTAGARDRLQGRDHDVVGDRLRLHEAQGETILRDIGDARGDRFAVAREGDG